MKINSCIITTVSSCQLACPFCRGGKALREKYPQIKRGKISRDTLMNILNKVPFNKCFYHNIGEPFLHNDILWLIEAGKNKGKEIEIHSNMQIMDKNIAEGIVNAKLDLLGVSCDGTTRDTYEKYRIGGDFEKLIYNAELVAEAKRKLNSKFPFIRWQMVVNKYNQHQAQDFEKFAKSHGADGIQCNNIYSQSPEGWFKIDEYAPTCGKFKAIKVIGTLTKCNEPNTRFTVDWNGDVYTCCNPAGIEEYKMGNINEQTFEEIWYGEKYEYARRFCSTGVPEDNGHKIQCHACFNKFPNENMRKNDMWFDCLEAVNNQNKNS